MSSTPINTFTIPKPDDWHLHLRDGAMLEAIAPFSARHFGRAIVMPNLETPVITAQQARDYRSRIRKALPHHPDFTPLMTAYLTDNTDPDDLTRGFADGSFFAAKLYPAGATTNSESGVTEIQIIAPILEKLQRIGMPLLIHGESTYPHVDIFDREAVFIDRILVPMRRSFPELKIVMEHITTAKAAQFIAAESQNGSLAATITPHHMLLNRNAMFDGGINPHHYCLPVFKREEDRQAIVLAATSGASMFFAGTDSAPHPRTAKETHHGKGGIFNAPQAIAIYAQIFDDTNALHRLTDFLCLNGANFYGEAINTKTMTLEKRQEPFPPMKPILTKEGAEIVPFPAQTPLYWRVIDQV